MCNFFYQELLMKCKGEKHDVRYLTNGNLLHAVFVAALSSRIRNELVLTVG